MFFSLFYMHNVLGNNIGKNIYGVKFQNDTWNTKTCWDVEIISSRSRMCRSQHTHNVNMEADT